MDIYEKITAFYNEIRTDKKIIGNTLFGRSMYAMKVGSGAPVGIAQYGIHGREFITAMLAVMQYEIGVAKGSCWIVPLVNPDGALLSETGLATASLSYQKELIAINGGDDFRLWKANGRGVDLNVNFPARWGKGDKNVRVAGAENFIGHHPFSEPETLALKYFTEEVKPDYTVSYHTKGEEIYWHFGQSMRTCLRDRRLAETIAKETGYAVAEAKGSVGGYKDWCIRRFHIPSFTIEVGADKYPHPLGEDALTEIIERNKTTLFALSKEIDGL